MTDDKHIDGLLLKLRRRYSNEEINSLAVQRNGELHVEMGKLKSRIHELEYENEKLRRERREYLALPDTERKEVDTKSKAAKKMMQQRQTINALQKKLRVLRKELEDWKLIAIRAKANQ